MSTTPWLGASAVDEARDADRGTDYSEKHTSADTIHTADHITGVKFVLVTSSVTLVVFLMLLDTSIIATAIPRITDQFHSLPDVGWYGAAYQLSSAALQPLTGKWYQYFSSKWTFLWCFFVFEIGSLIAGVAPTSKALIIGRAISGLGAAGLQNGGLTIMAGAVPMRRRPAVIGIMFGLGQLGIVVGPLVGGAFTEYLTWRWCFYINLPIGAVVAAFLIFVDFPDQVPKGPFLSTLRSNWTKFDLIGFGIFAPTAIMFLMALQFGGNEFAWDSPTIIGLFVGAGVLLMIFIAWELREGKDAMLPPHMIKHRTVWSSSIVILCLMSVVFISSYFLPIYFQSVRGFSPVRSGYSILPSILSQLFAAILSGQLTSKFGRYLPFVVAGTGLTTIGNGLISTFTSGISTGKWIGYQIIAGAGRGLALQMPITAVQNSVAPADIATGMSLIIFASTFGGAVAITIANTVFTNTLRANILQLAPDLDVTAVISAGATGVRNVVPSRRLGAVRQAYSDAINNVFYLIIGVTCVAFVASLGMGNHDIRKMKNENEHKNNAEEEVQRS